MGLWRFEWTRRWDDLWRPLPSERWSRLYDARPGRSVFSRPEVVRAWAETHGAAHGAEARVGFARGPDGAEALLGWTIVQKHGRFMKRRLLSPVGLGLFDPEDIITHDMPKAALDALWVEAARSLSAEYDAALFRLLTPERAPSSHERSEESPVLELRGVHDLEAALQRCGANHRGDVKRRLRRLSEKGKVALWVAGANDVVEALAGFRDHMVPAYEATWRNKPSGSLLAQSGVVPFVERILSEGLQAGWGHYVALRVDGRAIAWHVGFRDSEALYWWMPAHDPAWDASSPGKVLLAQLVALATEKQISRIEMLTGAHAYKLAWLPRCDRRVAVRFYAPTLRGSALRCYDVVRSYGAKLRHPSSQPGELRD